MLSIILRLLALSFLLLLLHHLQAFQHEISLMYRTKGKTLPAPARAALITLADPFFASCAVTLLTAARKVGKWRLPIILLAVDHANFRSADVAALNELGVVVLHTNPVFDDWLSRPVDNVDIFRELHVGKFRKMELFLSPVLRVYERLIFVDADGIINANLRPLLHVKFPPNVSVLMRQNDVSVGKGPLWNNELAVQMFTDEQLQHLARRFPNRVMTGGSCWFIVDIRSMPSPARLMDRSLELLCEFRAGFRLNDQTLISLLFYDSIALFPWCVWDELPVLNEPSELAAFCTHNMLVQKRLTGDYRFMYRHMSVKEKEQCALPEKRSRAVKASEIRLSGVEDKSKNVIEEHRLDHEADCTTALRQWRKRLLVE